MEFKDLKEFEKFLKVCRKKGVIEISYYGVSVKFGDLPTKAQSQAEEDDEIETEELSPDELAFFAVPNAGV